MKINTLDAPALIASQDVLTAVTGGSNPSVWLVCVVDAAEGTAIEITPQ